jgi:hypothetical protein
MKRILLAVVLKEIEPQRAQRKNPKSRKESFRFTDWYRFFQFAILNLFTCQKTMIRVFLIKMRRVFFRGGERKWQ